MKISPQDKALLITFSGASLLVLTFFFLGFKPYQNKIPEKYYEIPLVEKPEPEQPEPEKTEEPEQTKKTSAITHQAANSSRIQKEANRFFEQEDEIREAIKNEEITEQEHEENTGDEQLMTNYYKGRIAALHKKAEQPQKSEEKKSKETTKNNSSSSRHTTISYNLVDRNSIKIPNPVYTCSATGKVVVNIEVSGVGNVVKASFNRASSTTNNGCLVDQALKYANNALFNADSRTAQLGTITFEFQG